MKRIALAQPALTGNERDYVIECLDTNWISSLGRFIPEFEQRFAQFCEVDHGVSSNNGTTALHLALLAMGVGPGDEVIVPTLTFIASANAVSYCGATPVFVDSSPTSVNLDVTAVEKAITPRTKAIMPVHLYGEPADMRAISEIATNHSLLVVEDAAEAHGARCEGKRVGSLGDIGVFSFFGNKIVTTGEGGMATTSNEDFASRMRLTRGQGMDPQRRYWFPMVGYNYRMTNIQAAIGLGQIEHIDQSIEVRRRVARDYEAALTPHEHYLQRYETPAWADPVVWMYNVYLAGDTSADRRDKVMAYLDAQGIETRPVFYPMHQMPPYQNDGCFPNADHWAACGMTLPTHEGISTSDVEFIAAQLGIALSKI
jgi:perosamine synthetase